MSLKKQLLLTAVGLVFLSVAAAALAVLWNEAHLQIEERAALVAVSGARLREPSAIQRFAESMARSGETIRVVDASLNTVAAAGDADVELTETDIARLRASIEQRLPRSYQDAGGLKAVAPMVDASGQSIGATLLAFPSDWLQATISRRLQAAAPSILAILVVGVTLSFVAVLALMRPVVRLDAAVAALGSYRFRPESLDDLAKRTNELGRIARLLQRMANAETGWRRSLEALRQTRDELEHRVEERTRELTVALEEQRTLNNQLQVMDAGLRRSIDEMRILAEVSRTISLSPDAHSVLTTILTHAVRLSKSDAGTIYEFDADRGVFVARASDGLDAEAIRQLQTSGRWPETEIIGQAALQGQPTQVPDLWSTNGAAQDLGFRALLAVPMLKEGSLVGGLVMWRREPGDFEPETINLLQTIAVQSLLAVGPNVVRYENRWSVETRLSRGDPRIDVGAVRAAVLQAGDAAKAADLRRERLAMLRANEGPIDLPTVPKVVLHLTPVGAGDPSTRYDLFAGSRYLAPMGRGFTSQGVNFDGVLTCERRASQATAYAQAFWDGRIEMVDALLLTPRGDGRKEVPTRALEDSLIRALDFARRYCTEVQIPAPCSLGLALLGVRGYRLAVDDLVWSDISNHAIDRADLVFPEVAVEDWATPSEVVWRPLFDLLWNACGFQRCLDYDASGEWRPRW